MLDHGELKLETDGTWKTLVPKFLSRSRDQRFDRGVLGAALREAESNGFLSVTTQGQVARAASAKEHSILYSLRAVSGNVFVSTQSLFQNPDRFVLWNAVRPDEAPAIMGKAGSYHVSPTGVLDVALTRTVKDSPNLEKPTITVVVERTLALFLNTANPLDRAAAPLPEVAFDLARTELANLTHAVRFHAVPESLTPIERVDYFISFERGNDVIKTFQYTCFEKTGSPAVKDLDDLPAQHRDALREFKSKFVEGLKDYVEPDLTPRRPAGTIKP
jgi:hypothetical protein